MIQCVAAPDELLDELDDDEEFEDDDELDIMDEDDEDFDDEEVDELDDIDDDDAAELELIDEDVDEAELEDPLDAVLLLELADPPAPQPATDVATRIIANHENFIRYTLTINFCRPPNRLNSPFRNYQQQ